MYLTVKTHHRLKFGRELLCINFCINLKIVYTAPLQLQPTHMHIIFSDLLNENVHWKLLYILTDIKSERHIRSNEPPQICTVCLCRYILL